MAAATAAGLGGGDEPLVQGLCQRRRRLPRIRWLPCLDGRSLLRRRRRRNLGVGFGRIVVSEIEVPNMLANPV